MSSLLQKLTDFINECRCCAAAATDHPHARIKKLFGILCIRFRRHFIDGTSVFLLRMSCISLCYHRDLYGFTDLFHRQFHLIRSHGAVHTNGIHAHTLQCHCRRSDFRSQESESVSIHSKRTHDGQLAHLADGKNCRPHLLKTYHGLHHKKVHTGLVQGLRLLLINSHGFMYGKCAVWHQLFSRHGHIAGNQCAPLCSFPAQSHNTAVDLLHRHIHMFLLKHRFVSSKGGGIQDLCSRIHIFSLQTDQYVWMFDQPLFRTCICRHACQQKITSCRSVQQQYAGCCKSLKFFSVHCHLLLPILLSQESLRTFL